MKRTTLILVIGTALMVTACEETDVCTTPLHRNAASASEAQTECPLQEGRGYRVEIVAERVPRHEAPVSVSLSGQLRAPEGQEVSFEGGSERHHLRRVEDRGSGPYGPQAYRLVLRLKQFDASHEGIHELYLDDVVIEEDAGSALILRVQETPDHRTFVLTLGAIALLSFVGLTVGLMKQLA